MSRGDSQPHQTFAMMTTDGSKSRDGAASAPLRAVVIEPVGGHGGMNYYDIGLCDGLGRAGIDVTLHTCDRNPPAAVQGVFDVQTSFAGVYGQAPAWRRGLRYVRALVSALVRERLRGARVAHFHFFHVGPLEYLGVLLSSLLRYRVVVTAHDVESFKQELSVQGLVLRSYAHADAVVAHNRTSAAEVVDKLAVPPARVHVVPHGSYVDFAASAPPRAAARRAIGLAGHEGPVVLFFGQIKEVKGLDVLIDAFASLRQQMPDARLVIAGRVWKDDFGRYASQIQARGLEEYVSLHVRYVPDDEVAGFYAAADLVVLPYRRIYQSGVLLMAMSFGTPVVASDLAAMKEVVANGDTGFLFREGDANDLARVLQTALTDRDALQRVQAAAARCMRERFGWRQIGRELADVYRGERTE